MRNEQESKVLRGTTLMAGLLALLALSGCKQGEHLEQRREAAEKQLAQLEHVLATRDEQLRELKQLQIAEARLSQQLSAPTAEALAAAFAALPGMRVVPEQDGSMVVTGRAPLEAFGERLLALGQTQPGVAVSMLRVDGDAVEARVHVGSTEEPPPAPRPSPIGWVMPWNRERLSRLRAVEARITEVRERLPDVLDERGALQWRVNALQDLAARAAETRAQALAAARALAGPSPLLTELDVQVRESTLVASGRPTPGTGVAQLRSALGPHFEVRRAAPSDGAVRLELAPASVAGGASP
ncbi:MAG: hypothetical protein L0Y66_13635 [Myxococcaceae bacterium]|nr:hypothetical protein [Myxococcaceae bacterium]MCI0668848.1 hypothetical protein [Myxococcaceae bacterium]